MTIPGIKFETQVTLYTVTALLLLYTDYRFTVRLGICTLVAPFLTEKRTSQKRKLTQ